MNTQTPNTPQELMEMNTTPPTMEDVVEMWMKLPYEDKDNTVFELLMRMKNFFMNMGTKEMEKDGDVDGNFVGKCFYNKVTMEHILTLYKEV